MVPLLLQEGFRANGWLGMLLGTRLWYGFYGAVIDDDSLFMETMDRVCREID
eukprot:SAG31_NODE_19493_length_600_cov_0.988024_1_plen_51_part_10